MVIVVLGSSAVHCGLHEGCIFCEFLYILDPWTLCIHCGAITWSSCGLSNSPSVTPGV